MFLQILCFALLSTFLAAILGRAFNFWLCWWVAFLTLVAALLFA